jgi:hypothetical protein
MNGSEIILVMFLARLVIPVGLMLWIGEAARRREMADFRRM